MVDRREGVFRKGDIAAQTRNVFDFIRRTLAEGGLDETDVARLYTYAGEGWDRIAETRATIARVQREFYGDLHPAVTASCVTRLAFEDLLIEIQRWR